MSNIPHQLDTAKKLAEALHENPVLIGDIEGLETTITRADKERAQIHKALYNVIAEGLSKTPGWGWITAFSSSACPENMSLFCDDSLNVKAIELIDASNNSTTITEDIFDLNEVAVFMVEEVLKDNR